MRSFDGRRAAGAALLAGLLAAGAAWAAPPAWDEPTLQGRYRQALRAVGGGDQEAALALLVELERDALGEVPPPRLIEQFWRLKLQVVAEVLRDSSPDVLVPVVMLHHDAYLEHREAGRAILAGHARTMASELLEVYVERSTGAADAARIASGVLTSFGGYLQEGWSLRLAASYFRRALELEPRNEAALVALAASFEKLGRYSEAIELFVKAAALEPGNAQTRLRLALCRSRSGEVERAAAELRALTAGDPAPWVLSLAYQELAGLAIEAGQWESAERLLRAALERLPRDPHLPVQLALVLDRQQRRKQATRLVEELVAQGETESARYRYARWPGVLIEGRRRDLEEALVTRRPELLAGLDRPAPVAGG